MLGNYKFEHDIHDSYQVKGSKYIHAQISSTFQHANTEDSWNDYCKNKLGAELMKILKVLKFKVP
jgi:hypothetical protein